MNRVSTELAKRVKERGSILIAGLKRCTLVLLCVSITIFSGMGIVHAQLATLNPAANVTDTSALLSGFVDPNGHDTHWYISVWPGVTYNPYPPTCGEGSLSGSAGNTPVSCTAQGLTPSTTYTFELNADWPGTTATAGQPPNQGASGWLQFTTQPAAPSFDFTMMISPSSVSVNQGETAHYTVGVTYSDPSYAGTMINIQLTGLGPAMNYNLLQNGDLTITTNPATPTGSYPIVLTGSANGVTHQTGLTLIVMSAQTSTAIIPSTAPATMTTLAVITTPTVSVTTVITQTAIVQPSSTSTQASTSDVLGWLQQNSLLIIAILVIALAALLLSKRRRSTGQITQAQPQPVNITYCPKCGTPNSTTDSYCRKCGAKLLNITD